MKETMMNPENRIETEARQGDLTSMGRLTRKPEEVGQMLGIGRNGVYALLHSKKLRCIKVGRKILIPLSAIDEFLTAKPN